MTPKMITVHCADTPNGRNDTGEDIKRYHTAPLPSEAVLAKVAATKDPKEKARLLAGTGRGWPNIGYHGVVELNGDFYRGLPDDHVGMHVAEHNTGNLGICLIGTDKFTEKQFQSLLWVVKHWREAYGITEDKIFAHCEWDTARAQGKTCPNIPGLTLRMFFRTEDFSLVKPYFIGSPAVV
jgi:N-acetylmuramoyl-L-alanine amidase